MYIQTIELHFKKRILHIFHIISVTFIYFFMLENHVGNIHVQTYTKIVETINNLNKKSFSS